MPWKSTRNVLLASALLIWQVPAAVAEKVRGKETCTSGSYDRTIGGKKYTCATKCTTPVTDTTCTGGACSTTVSNEVTYKDCSEKAATQRPRDAVRAPPPAGILDTSRPEGGTGPRPVGQPPKAVAPVLR
jgi:hypothetical protein